MSKVEDGCVNTRQGEFSENSKNNISGSNRDVTSKGKQQSETWSLVAKGILRLLWNINVKIWSSDNQ